MGSIGQRPQLQRAYLVIGRYSSSKTVCMYLSTIPANIEISKKYWKNNKSEWILEFHENSLDDQST